jgi:predicted PurR-regulated permease PerM
MIKAIENSPANRLLLFTVLLTIILCYGRELLVPLVYSAFFAMLLAPVCCKLENKGINRTFSVVICVFILLVALLGIFAIIVSEMSTFVDDLPVIQKKLLMMIGSAETYISKTFHLTRTSQSKMIERQINTIGQSTGTYFGAVINSITGTLGGLILIIVYTFLLLFHKEKYESFFVKVFSDHEPARIKTILQEVTGIGQKYLAGRAISVLFLWVIYTIALLLFGLKTAILLAAIAALLSIIPYIGSILGSVFPFLMALVTKDLITAVWITVALLFLHALSTYFVEPVIIGRKVKLSALAMLVGIIAGGFIWGVSGMILFIPILAMVKIVCEHVDNLQPYAFLIGDPDEGNPSRIEEWFKNKFGKTRGRKNHTPHKVSLPIKGSRVATSRPK